MNKKASKIIHRFASKTYAKAELTNPGIIDKKAKELKREYKQTPWNKRNKFLDLLK